MRLRVFRLKNGKLELAGMREVRPDDSIIEGTTPMTEVSLKESLSPPTQRELANARKSLSNGKLAKSYKAGHPGAGDKEIAAFVQGREPDPPSDSLDDSLRRAHPEYTDAQIAIFKRGR